MKFLAYIMAILVLALSCLPCADGASTSGKTTIELVDSSEHEEENHEDTCSPFCQCSCCAGLSISHLVASITYEIKYYNYTYSPFNHSQIIEISLPIWQPPRLV